MNIKIVSLLIALITGTSTVFALKNTEVNETKEQVSEIVQQSLESLEWGLLLEAEGAFADTEGKSSSDLVLATVEFTLDTAVNDWVSAHVGLLWEEDDTEENHLDEAFITIGNSETLPLFVTAGRLYLPFGKLDSEFISDPLVLELAEIRESAGLVGFANDWIDISVGAFNGSADGDDKVENGVGSLRLTPCDVFHFGIYGISDLMETDVIQSAIEEVGSTLGFQQTAAAGCYAHFHFDHLILNAEFVTALEDFSWDGTTYTPLTYNFEATTAVCEKCSVSLRFEGSNDFTEFGYAKQQFGGVFSYAANELLTVSGEYLHAEDLGGTDQADLVTLQLALDI